MRQLIFAVTGDGVTHLLFTAPDSFDVQRWAESRRHAFDVLGIRSLRVERVVL